MPLSNLGAPGHSFLLPYTLFLLAYITLLTNLNLELTLCALLGPRTVWQIASAQLLLLGLGRGHMSHFSLGQVPSRCSLPPSPETAPVTVAQSTSTEEGWFPCL